MDRLKLENLYKERTLIKQLLSIDRVRYSFLEVRSQEIKMEINSNYAPITDGVFLMYDAELAKKIIENAINNYKTFILNQ